MMISPEAFYDRELKGKSSSQILSKIRGLKNEIGRLKNLIESPDYNSQVVDYPTPHTQLFCNRLYLEKAKEALSESGGTYQPSKAEQRALSIDNSIPYLTKLVFSIGGYFGGYTTTTITFCEECMKVKKEKLYEMKSDEEQTVAYPENKESFMEMLRDIHLGEWKSRYDNICVLDGTQWNLELYFSNGHKKVSFGGSNAYPYNFDDFCSLIGESNDAEADDE